MKIIRTTIAEIEQENPYLLNEQEWKRLKTDFQVGDEVVRFSDLDGGQGDFITGERGVALRRGNELICKAVLEIIG